MTYKILDCTLRDGGYYTNWDFPDELLDVYSTSLATTDVSYVELGYRSPPQGGYAGRFHYLPDETLARVRATLRSDQVLGLMLDAKNVQPQQVQRLLSSATKTVGLVRMAVAPEQIPHGIVLAREIASMGFRVGFNVMYLSRYFDKLELLAALASAGDCIDSVALVDSFGGVMPEQVGQAVRLAKARLPQLIGFHGHDNISLAFANTLAAIQAGADIIDSTVLGMGRGAGNLRTELLLAYKSFSEKRHSDFSALSECVEAFKVLQRKYEWGTNLPYMMSGFGDLPQKDVMDWLGKRRYATSTVIDALQNQAGSSVDLSQLPEVSTSRLDAERCLVIGGGPSAREHASALRELARRGRYLVIHSSLRNIAYFAGSGVRQVVCLPGHDAWRSREEYRAVKHDSELVFVVPPPPRFRGAIPDVPVERVFQASPIGAPETRLGPVSDVGPASLSLGVALALGARELLLAGFDGYSQATLAHQELHAEVQSIFDVLAERPSQLRIAAITPTIYRLQQQSVYGILSNLQSSE